MVGCRLEKCLVYKLPMTINFIKKIRALFKRNEGVSLMELMVAVSVFIIVISVAVGSFVQSMRTQRIALALISANDSINLSIEQMAREIRTGYLFCTATVPIATTTPGFNCDALALDASGDHEFQFANADGIIVRYRLNSATFALEKGTPNSLCPGGLLSPDGFCYKPITADNVKVSRFVVKLNHSDTEPVPYPPLITLIMSVTSKEPDVESLNIFTDMETSISPRCGQNGCPSDI